MIVTRHFVFVHLPKTGGTWVRDRLKQYAMRTWLLDERPGHHPAREAPEGRPILGIIRNPWDWYVSSYFFRRHNIQQRRGAWARPERDWLPGMVEWAKIMEKLPNGAPGFQKALPLMARAGDGKMFTARIEQMPAEDGRLTYRYEQFLCDEEGTLLCEVARFERLRADVEAFLKRHQVPMHPRLLHALRTSKPTNTSPHRPYREYYDDASRALVATADRAIIEKYGYEF